MTGLSCTLLTALAFFLTCADGSAHGVGKERSYSPVILLRHNDYLTDRYHRPAKTTLCGTVTCPAKKECRKRNGRARCTCKLYCSPLWRMIRPVCGTDGRSYRSLCHLRRSNCRQGDTNIHFQHPGHCRVDIKKTEMIPAAMLVHPPSQSNHLPQESSALEDRENSLTAQGNMIATMFRQRIRQYVKEHGLPTRSRNNVK